eukprot:GHVU01207317.1.p2 GENE.GHVU01207317.1~~GHVU01207317.1.p2  ORF type:complete len:120 (-),score=5.63 GHVU01207317.1:103-462(-)
MWKASFYHEYHLATRYTPRRFPGAPNTSTGIDVPVIIFEVVFFSCFLLVVSFGSFFDLPFPPFLSSCRPSTNVSNHIGSGNEGLEGTGSTTGSRQTQMKKRAVNEQESHGKVKPRCNPR